MSARLTVMDGDMKDLNVKLIDTQDRFSQHSRSIDLVLDKEFKRIEKVTRKHEEIMEDATRENKEIISKLEKKNQL